MTERDPAKLGVIYAAGGSGGHIYPMLAVEETLRAEHDTDAVWLCSERTIDADVLNAAGREHTPIPARQAARSPKALASLAWNWGGAVRAARTAIADLRDRTDRIVMLTTGGFVSAPAAQAAQREGVPIVVLALDAIPGRASRFVARRAAALLSVYELSRYQNVGPVVRSSARATLEPAEARAQFGLDPGRPVLLITGGSQGAQSINNLALALTQAHRGVFDRWQIIHQTGRADEDRVRARYDTLGIRCAVAPLLDPVGTALAAADLALTRAGAGTVAELWAARLPAVLMPYPYHRDQHQAANAAPLVGGGILRTDRVDPAKNLAEAGQSVLKLMQTPDNLAAMRAALEALPEADGAERVATVLASIAEARPTRAGRSPGVTRTPLGRHPY